MSLGFCVYSIVTSTGKSFGDIAANHSPSPAGRRYYISFQSRQPTLSTPFKPIRA